MILVCMLSMVFESCVQVHYQTKFIPSKHVPPVCTSTGFGVAERVVCSWATARVLCVCVCVHVCMCACMRLCVKVYKYSSLTKVSLVSTNCHIALTLTETPFEMSKTQWQGLHVGELVGKSINHLLPSLFPVTRVLWFCQDITCSGSKFSLLICHHITKCAHYSIVAVLLGWQRGRTRLDLLQLLVFTTCTHNQYASSPLLH